MKKLLCDYMFLDEADDGSGGGGGAAGDPKAGDQKAGDPKSDDPKAGDPKAGDQKADDPKAGDQKAGDPKADDPKAGDQKAGASLLDEPEEEEVKPEEQKAEATPEEVEAFVAKIGKVDIEIDGVALPWDEEAVKAIAPVLVKNKISDTAANELVGAYAKYVAGQAQAAVEADKLFVKGLVEECNKRFGTDVKRFANEGRRGGIKVFGAELFGRLSKIPAFGSDPDIIEALAKIGRTSTPETAGGSSSPVPKEKDFADRFYSDKEIGKK
jgi:hypothetical protein